MARLAITPAKIVKMLESYADNALRICVPAVCADTVYRLILCFSEYSFALNRYVAPHRIQSIIGRCFSYSTAWLIFSGLIGLVLLLRIATTGRNPLFLRDFMFMPLYWVFLYLHVAHPHSNLDYAKWIRTKHGLDYGEGMASNYFHGYLKLAMPSHTSESERGIRQRIDLYCSQQGVEFITDKLVILIPNMLYVPPKIESKVLEKATPLEPVYKNRAGVHRPFKNDVYRFKDEKDKKVYYIAMEGATPLLSFYEAMHSHYTSTWQMKEMQREILFKFCQSLKRMVSEYPGTKNDIEIIFYNALTGDNQHQDVGDVLKAHFLNKKRN